MPKKVLLVEDDKDAIFLYGEALKKAGYTLSVAEDGLAGFEMLHKGGYDLVLLDIALPKMDGLEILQKLKSDPPEVKNGPILVLTNLVKDKLKHETKDYGVTDVLVKSDYTPPQIATLVGTTIDSIT